MFIKGFRLVNLFKVIFRFFYFWIIKCFSRFSKSLTYIKSFKSFFILYKHKFPSWLKISLKFFKFFRYNHFIKVSQCSHGIFRVNYNIIFIWRFNFIYCKFFCKGGTAYKYRNINSCITKYSHSINHFSGRLDKKSWKSDKISFFCYNSFPYFFCRSINSKVNNIVSIISYYYSYKVFSNIMNISLNSCHNNSSLCCRIRFFHKLFQMWNRSLHYFSTLKNFSNNKIIFIEKPSNFIHSCH